MKLIHTRCSEYPMELDWLSRYSRSLLADFLANDITKVAISALKSFSERPTPTRETMESWFEVIQLLDNVSFAS